MTKIVLVCLFLVFIVLSLSYGQDIEVEADADVFQNAPVRMSSQHAASEADPALMRAASHGDLVLVKEFIKSRQPVAARNRQGWSALTYAVANGFPDVVRELLRAGAPINVMENDLWTPLMFAAFQVRALPCHSLGSVPCLLGSLPRCSHGPLSPAFHRAMLVWWSCLFNQVLS